MTTVVVAVPELIDDGIMERAGLEVAVHIPFAIKRLQVHISTFETYLREFHPPPGYPPDRHETYHQEQRLCALLQSATGTTSEILLPPTESDLLGGIALLAICNRAFSQVHCAVCSRTYLPSDISVEPWSHMVRGNPHGGRIARCPGDHILSHLHEWLS